MITKKISLHFILLQKHLLIVDNLRKWFAENLTYSCLLCLSWMCNTFIIMQPSSPALASIQILFWISQLQLEAVILVWAVKLDLIQLPLRLSSIMLGLAWTSQISLLHFYCKHTGSLISLYKRVFILSPVLIFYMLCLFVLKGICIFVKFAKLLFAKKYGHLISCEHFWIRQILHGLHGTCDMWEWTECLTLC